MNYNFCTLLGENYLIKGLALYQSLKTHCPNFKLWILCMDDTTLRILKRININTDKVVLIGLKDFENTRLLSVKKKRTFGEYCWTCTPFLPMHIFRNNPRLRQIAYLDADLFFYSTPKPIYDQLGRNSIMIIPHNHFYKYKHLEKAHGKYNVGMLIFKNDSTAERCLKYWGRKCIEWCYCRREYKRYGDQFYLEDFPIKFKHVCVLSHKGACLAPWNMPSYKIVRRQRKIYIDNDLLIFLHAASSKLFSNRSLNPIDNPIFKYKNENMDIVYEPYKIALLKSLDLVRNYYPKFESGIEPTKSLLFKRYIKHKIETFLHISNL